MTKQLSIFDRPAPYQPSETSHAAAKSLRRSELNELRLNVLAAIQACDRTADEVAEYLGLSVLTVRPRVTELKKMGLIVPTEKRRRNISGQTASVWRIR